MDAWIDKLNEVDGIIAKSHHPVHPHLPMRVGGPADCWVRCSTLTALRESLPLIRRKTWRIHWPFQDWLVRDGGVQGCVLRLEGEFETVWRTREYIELGSAALWSSTTGLGLSSRELQSWAGSVGSLLCGDEIKHLRGFNFEIDWLRGQTIETVNISSKQSIELPKTAIPIKIRIFGQRKSRKGKPHGSGYAFLLDKSKEPRSILEELQLHSVRLRDWKISQNDPNRIVHTGHGNFEDVVLLQKALNQRIKQIRNTSLQFRIPVIGRKKL